ncbi:MAG: penicillin-binding protein 2 [Rhizobiaceae bacterium]|jgi:cell division protein FtsI (penicillin-binding protein 3)|nr:penicillin-binding protein 2 [Rhizobiaceae bacterium]
MSTPRFANGLRGNTRPSPEDIWRGRKGKRARSRIALAMLGFGAAFALIGGRLAYFGFTSIDATTTASLPSLTTARPDILDSTGTLLATDIRISSLFAEPFRIPDPDDAVRKLAMALPDIPFAELERKLKSGSRFVWLKRQITPKQENEIRALGIPGVAFRTEHRRVYPKGHLASHIHGITNIDNHGLTGLERHIDSSGLAALREMGLTADGKLEPVTLSINANVQHVVLDELTKAKALYRAIAAAGVVLNAKTGEVVAMVSLPDFDPNNPVDINEKDRLNRMSAGVYEMGSTFKVFTTAMALDSGRVWLDDRFDARSPIRIGGHSIGDFHGKKRVLTTEEVFIYSSNIGTAKMADVVGTEGHKAFLERIGLTTRMQTELPEIATPTQPKEWKKIHSVTISFGHGASTTPLQTAVATAAVVNGGKLIPPTFYPRTQAQADAIASQVLHPETSTAMRYLFRSNVENGSGRRAEVPGYFVGGKTGTAEKVVGGRYSTNHRFNAFLAAFPSNDPQYVVLTVLDEPKPLEGQSAATSGLNAAPTAGAIIRRSAPLLGMKPDFSQNIEALKADIRRPKAG